MSSAEKRFSQNFQKRLSGYGLREAKGLSVVEFKKPAWAEMEDATTNKRHSRNVSDGQIDVAQLKRLYHDNNNNNSSASDFPDGIQNVGMNGDISRGSPRSTTVSTERLPRTMPRRSVSSSALELRLNPTSDINLSQKNPLSPVVDSGKTTPEVGDQDDRVVSSLSSDKEGASRPADSSNGRTNNGGTIEEVISPAAPVPEVKTVRFDLTPHHIPGDRSSTSSSDSASNQSDALSPSPDSPDEDLLQNNIASSPSDLPDDKAYHTRAYSPPPTPSLTEQDPELQNSSSPTSTVSSDIGVAPEDANDEDDVEPSTTSSPINETKVNHIQGDDHAAPTDPSTATSYENLESSQHADSTSIDMIDADHTSPTDLPPPSTTETDDVGDDCHIYVDDEGVEEDEEEEEEEEAQNQTQDSPVSEPTSPFYYMTWIKDQDETLL